MKTLLIITIGTVYKL